MNINRTIIVQRDSRDLTSRVVETLGQYAEARAALGTITNARDRAEAAAQAAEEAAAEASGSSFTYADRAAMLADTRQYPVGSVILTRAEDYSYVVIPQPDTTEHVANAGGSKMHVTGRDGQFKLAAFNVDANTGTDYVSTVQTAVDFVSASGGGTINFPVGTVNVGFSGTMVGPRRAGITPRNNVTLRGAGQGVTVLRVADGANIDLIASNRFPVGGETTLRNFHVEDMTLDGNAANQSPTAAEGFNVRLWGFQDCGLRNVRSISSNTWGIRLEYGDGLSINNVVCRHGAQTNSDGIHLVDVDNVTGGGIDVYTEGDDGFIVEVTNKTEISGYAMAGIRVRAPNGLNLPARGLLLLADPNVNIGAARAMRNMSIVGVSASDCSGAGVIATGAIFENIHIQATVANCGFGMILSPGSASFTGRMRNCSFDVDIFGCRDNGMGGGTGTSMFCNDTNGSISSNHIRMNVFDPAPGIVAVNLRGQAWSGEINVTYPGATNRPPNGVVLYCVNSHLSVSSIGSACGLNCQPAANQNVLHLGRVEGNGDHAVKILSGATGHHFSGGWLGGTVQNEANAKFWGVAGADNKGAVNATTTAAGVVVVPHGLVGTPATVVTQIYGQTGIAAVRIISRTATNFTMLCLDGAGNPVNAATASIGWEASL